LIVGLAGRDPVPLTLLPGDRNAVPLMAALPCRPALGERSCVLAAAAGIQGAAGWAAFAAAATSEAVSASHRTCGLKA
jgi:hypothetical protein